MSRSKLLLHVIDIAPADGTDPIDSAKTIISELRKFQPELAERDRWLVFSKSDLVLEEELSSICAAIKAGLDWQGPCYTISAVTRTGLKPLIYDIMAYVESADAL